MPSSVVVIHGLTSSPRALWRIHHWLAEAGWAASTLNLLGHGGRGTAPSYALRAFADDIASAGPWDLVIGHSLGAAAATLAAANNSGWAQRLVLIEPAWYLAADDRDATRALEIAGLGLTRDDLIGRPGYEERDVEAKLAGLEGVAEGVVAGLFDDNPTWDIRAAAAALTVPTLVIAGDPAVSTALAPADAESVLALNPLVTCQRIQGAGHSPFRDSPEGTRTVLLDWIGQPPSG